MIPKSRGPGRAIAGGMLVCALILLLASAARSPSGVTAAERSSWLNFWLTAQTNIQSWSADFVQTRTLKVLAQPLTAAGHVWFAAPNRFRWELGNPPETIAVRNQDEMLVIYPKLKRAERYPLAGQAMGRWRDALALLEAGFPRSEGELLSRFKIISETATNAGVEVVLQPRSPGARQMMPLLKIGFSTNDFSLRSTELQFADGSTMRNEFHQAKLNPPIKENRFLPSLGPDYKVVEPLKK